MGASHSTIAAWDELFNALSSPITPWNDLFAALESPQSLREYILAAKHDSLNETPRTTSNTTTPPRDAPSPTDPSSNSAPSSDKSSSSTSDTSPRDAPPAPSAPSSAASPPAPARARPWRQLSMQIELLVRTLLVDEKLLAVSKIAESFDTAAFCLGQLVSHEPELMASLSLAPQVVEGLSAALRQGWSVHHGVAKFSANALTILCICETAREEVRRLAIDELLSGLSAWLEVSLERVDSDEVCGCHCGNAALSACCWLERLLGQPDELLALAVCAHPSLQRIIRDVLRVVSLEDGNSFSLTRLLCVPGLLSALRAADPETATMAISFVAFSLDEFDDPMFTSDAVQSLLVLLRLDGGVEALLSHRASFHVLTSLSADACNLPSAASALELVAGTPAGRSALYRLADALDSGRRVDAATESDAGELECLPGTRDEEVDMIVPVGEDAALDEL